MINKFMGGEGGADLVAGRVKNLLRGWHGIDVPYMERQSWNLVVLLLNKYLARHAPPDGERQG